MLVEFGDKKLKGFWEYSIENVQKTETFALPSYKGSKMRSYIPPKEGALNTLTVSVNYEARTTKFIVKDLETGEILTTGAAVLSVHDRYDKRVGMHISFNRAIQGLFDIDLRRAFYSKLLEGKKNKNFKLNISQHS